MKKLIFVMTLLLLASCDQKAPPTTPTATSKATSNLLPDFASFEDTQAKKQAFFNFLLPIIYNANQEILLERAIAEQWISKPNHLSSAKRKKLDKILVKYRITTDEPATQQQLLLEHINIIPPSLVLAQAANESAWGTSRFAVEGNNLFGQWCYDAGCGLIPGERNHSATHEVRVFKSPAESVASYMRNLNSHPQYKDLRQLRKQLVEQKETISGLVLAEGLIGYSERREAYVEEIQAMIRYNRLQTLDEHPLGPPKEATNL